MIESFKKIIGSLSLRQHGLLTRTTQLPMTTTERRNQNKIKIISLYDRFSSPKPKPFPFVIENSMY